MESPQAFFQSESENFLKPVTLRELAERRIITKDLNGATPWLRAKVGVFPIDIQFQQRDDVYELF
ncbi:MAG TPA: hypothetical protein VEG61_04695 [Candidatus Dormibacteraeota bacterium]|nr:hypothetical protein [Candidatus Dormibacteraeota bacterium]